MYEKRVGNILTGLEFNDTFYNYMNLELPEECINFKYLPLCQGGCPTQRLKNGNKPYCYTTKVEFKENLLRVFDIWHKQNLSDSKG